MSTSVDEPLAIELRDLRSYTKIKEKQVKTLGDLLDERDQRIGELERQVESLQQCRKTAILELLDVSGVVNDKQTRILELRNELRNVQNGLGEAHSIEQQQPGNDESEEEKRQLMAQINQSVRECEELRRNLKTAQDESAHYYEQFEECQRQLQACRSEKAHFWQQCTELEEHNRVLSNRASSLLSELQSERDSNQIFKEQLRNIERNLPMNANEVLVWKAKYFESENRRLEQANMSLHHMIDSWQPVNTNCYARTTLSPTYIRPLERSFSDGAEFTPVKLQVPLGKEKESDELTTLQLLEEESEKKRREADRALQEIEETRRELMNQTVNFSETANDSGYPQSPVQDKEDTKKGTAVNDECNEDRTNDSCEGSTTNIVTVQDMTSHNDDITQWG